MNSSLVQTAEIRLQCLPAVTVSGLYVHIPFCFHKCHYCDFYSIVNQSHQRMKDFVNRVLAEAELWAKGQPLLRPATVFFGGGTPTLLPPDLMAQLIRGLKQRLDLSQVQEWTVEANPATASAEYCSMLRENGVDRISFGAQSFDVDQLRTLQRHHHPDDVFQSIESARRAGFTRLNIDLIYAIPWQTLESWQSTLEQAIGLGLSHYSCYALTYEPNTPLAVKKRLGLVKPIEEQLELAMMKYARRRLAEAGCPAYEISNYSAPGQQCQHNLLYWTGGNYAGLGPSAASHVEGLRFKNPPHLGHWEHSIDRCQLAAVDVEILTPLQRAGELVMLGLRLSEGIDFADYEARSGFDARKLFAGQIECLACVGLLEVDDRGFRLTDRGLAVADSVCAQFLHAIPDAPV